MTLYHGGARIPAGYGADAAASTVPAATFDWTSFAKSMATVTVSGIEAYQAITTTEQQAKAALAAQKQQNRQALALARAQSTPAPGSAPGPAPGYSPAPAASGIDTTTLLLLGGLGLAAAYFLTRSK
jgi:hypothetical protein